MSRNIFAAAMIAGALCFGCAPPAEQAADPVPVIRIAAVAGQQESMVSLDTRSTFSCTAIYEFPDRPYLAQDCSLPRPVGAWERDPEKDAAWVKAYCADGAEFSPFEDRTAVEMCTGEMTGSCPMEECHK